MRPGIAAGPRSGRARPSAAARGRAAGVALHAGAVAHQRVVAAFAAGLALIALQLRLGARVHGDDPRGKRGGRRGAGRHRGLRHQRVQRRDRIGRARKRHAARRTTAQHHQFLRQALAQIARGGDLPQHLERLRGGRLAHRLDVRGLALLVPATEIIEGGSLRLDMGQIGAVEIAHRQLAEDIVEDRGRVLDRVIALHHAGRFELGEGEGVDEFLERHAVLQPDRNRDGEVVHHRAEARAFLVHVDEDLAERAVIVFASAQIDLVTADDRLLGIALAARRQLLAVRADDLLHHHLLDDLLGKGDGLFLLAAGGEDLLGLLVILDQRRGERLAQLRAVAVECVRLDAERPAQLVGGQRILDRRRVRHVDRLRDRARDEALRRGHHPDVAVDGQIALAGLAAGIGAVENRIMRGLQERRALEGHRAANVVVRRVDLRLGETEVAQHVEGRVVQLLDRDAQRLRAEILAQRPLVEDEADVEGRGQCRLDLLDLGRAETMADERGAVDARAIAQGSVADRIADDLLDLRRGIAERFEGRGHRAVDDLEVAATGELLELHQGEIGLDARRVAIHHQADGARGRDHRDLRVAEAMRLAKRQRLVPGRFRQRDQRRVGTVRSIERHRLHFEPLVARRAPMRRGAVVADHPQHVGGVLRMAREGAQLGRHLGRGRIGDAGHHRGERRAQRPALVRVVAKPHGHQQPADVRVTETQRAEVIGALRDLLARELRHQHRDLERDRPQPGGMHIGGRIDLAALVEGQQVHRGKVARRVVKEHVFRARVRAADRTVLGAGVPLVHRVMELDAGVGAGPGGMADLIPQLARPHRLRHLAVGAAQQLPRRIFLHRLQEGVGDAHRVVRVLPRDRDIGFRIPIGVIGREFDAVEALARILQHAVDVGFRDQRLLGRADRCLQPRVQRRIDAALFRAVPGADRVEDLVQLALVHLRAGNERGDLLLLDHLPVDEGLDVGVIHVADHHLRRAPRGAARLDRAGRPVADLQKAHQPRGLAAARELLALGTQAREVGAGARAILEETCLADPQVHDPALAHQIVAHRLDEAGMRLRMFVGAGRFRQLAGDVVDVIVALRRAIDAIGPVQAGVEPLRAVRRGHLLGQHEAHLVVIGARVVLGAEIAALPAPVGPGAGQPVEHLLGRGFAHNALIFRQVLKRLGVGDRAPQELGHALLAHLLQRRGNARLAEVFLREHVGGNLAPALGHLDAVVVEHDLAVRVANFRRGGGEGDLAIGAGLGRGELAFDLHLHCPVFKSNPPCRLRKDRGARPEACSRGRPSRFRSTRGEVPSRACSATTSGGFPADVHKLA
ncbi:hypothetical protein SDC9_38730 [bioreactor metagenome]|uniref:Uncharacterized protein n=1 Tax=bioreactor metagenome TaxID=1076179 RepID=A0A644VMP9_9ZZZZ